MLRAGARIPPGIVGSSPLTRGKRVRSLDNLGQVGLIPAHAGKTRPVAGASGWVEAHPRSRGENTLGSALAHQPPGSSPLTRGKRRRTAWLHGGRGLIPAHAGKTTTLPALPCPSPAHPRSRGENSGDLAHQPLETGSSPLTRGKPFRRARAGVRERLIPAHAGKTPRWARTLPNHGAHPRSRGENNALAMPVMRTLGSSPLTRGKHQHVGRREHHVRLIPAHAGKTTQTYHG